jgi:hypothetical protein
MAKGNNNNGNSTKEVTDKRDADHNKVSASTNQVSGTPRGNKGDKTKDKATDLNASALPKLAPNKGKSPSRRVRKPAAKSQLASPKTTIGTAVTSAVSSKTPPFEVSFELKTPKDDSKVVATTDIASTEVAPPKSDQVTQEDPENASASGESSASQEVADDAPGDNDVIESDDDEDSGDDEGNGLEGSDEQDKTDVFTAYSDDSGYNFEIGLGHGALLLGAMIARDVLEIFVHTLNLALNEAEEEAVDYCLPEKFYPIAYVLLSSGQHAEYGIADRISSNVSEEAMEDLVRYRKILNTEVNRSRSRRSNNTPAVIRQFRNVVLKWIADNYSSHDDLSSSSSN